MLWHWVLIASLLAIGMLLVAWMGLIERELKKERQKRARYSNLGYREGSKR